MKRIMALIFLLFCTTAWSESTLTLTSTMFDGPAKGQSINLDAINISKHNQCASLKQTFESCSYNVSNGILTATYKLTVSFLQENSDIFSLKCTVGLIDQKSPFTNIDFLDESNNVIEFPYVFSYSSSKDIYIRFKIKVNGSHLAPDYTNLIKVEVIPHV